ncbi:homoserine kinase [Marinomonas sp. MED121]|uniref:homoserine kinase n=1 Tax=Marinomonas sp. MED121 TaxID=314277 RepID=UPI0002DE8F01|nr:homoserine kinase [Marinomonas sp. MED121]
MAVYTSLTQDDMLALLAEYDLGDLVSFKGISGGVENTNYFVNSTQGKYVLTIFEEFEAEEVPYFLDVVAHFKKAGFNVPAAIFDQQGERLKSVKNKPAIMVDCFNGDELVSTSANACQQMGKQLGLLHKVGQSFPDQRPSHRGVAWWQATSQSLNAQLPEDEAELLAEQVASFDTFLEQANTLPMGTIHGDLFYNNTLFDGDSLSAIIDFYNACHSWLIYDLAIVVNDWCTDRASGNIDMDKYEALITAYRAERNLSEEEIQAWPHMLRVAAMRFWLSRLEAWYGAINDPERLAQQHDPKEFKRILQARCESTPAL